MEHLDDNPLLTRQLAFVAPRSRKNPRNKVLCGNCYQRRLPAKPSCTNPLRPPAGSTASLEAWSFPTNR